MTDSTPSDETNVTPGASRDGGPGRSELIYCGLCGALNPATNFYCAACGTTLVDAFHGTEGLRVYERPDSASRLVEIVPAGTELDVLEDPDAPEDFVRVQLSQGRLGYVRLSDVEALAKVMTVAPPGAPDINTNARGCVTPVAAVGALALLVVLAGLMYILLGRADRADTGVIGLVFCVFVLPLLIVMIGLYLYSRGRDERLEEDEGSPG